MAGSVPDLDLLDEAAVSAVREAGLADIEAAGLLGALGAVHAAFPGGQAPLVTANRTIGSLEPTQRDLTDKNLGQTRKVLTEALEGRKAVPAAEYEICMLAEESVDVTLPAARRPTGTRHPLETLVEEVVDFFVVMGRDIVKGPEIEHEWFNFDSLNFDIGHPVHQMQNTFYIDGRSVGAETEGSAHLVTYMYASPVQLHAMLSCGASLYIARPDRIFRPNALGATHTPVLHQMEGLAIDKSLTVVHLEGVLDHFVKAMFGPETRIRLRSPYFPSTGPNAEMDPRLLQKKGGPDWIGWDGYGMVNPNALRTNGVDSEVCSSFAFGVGIERALMLRHGIADVHDIAEGDVRFSQQFGVNGRGN